MTSEKKTLKESTDEWTDLSSLSTPEVANLFNFHTWFREQNFELKLHQSQNDLSLNLYTPEIKMTLALTHQRHLSNLCLLRQDLTGQLNMSQILVKLQQQVIDVQVVPLQPWHIARWLIRLFRRHGPLTDTQVTKHAARWGLSQEQAISVLVHFPQDFVQQPRISQEAVWRLTPWVERRRSFPAMRNWHSTTCYEDMATQFWVQIKHSPTPQEEWSEVVRGRVKQLRSIPNLPPYFFESYQGTFLQRTSFRPEVRPRRLALNPEKLPEDPYLELQTSQGNYTYSVDGGAFLQDSPQGVMVANAYATQRLTQLLLEDPNVIPLARGLFLKEVCQVLMITCRQEGK